MPKKEMEWSHHKGNFLTTLGFVLLLIGAMRYYGVDWNVVWMVIGVVLILKGLWIKHKE